jgi:hypothetical protein
MRTKLSLVLLQVMKMRGAGAAAGMPMRSGRINSNTTMRLSRIIFLVMRSGRLA